MFKLIQLLWYLFIEYISEAKKNKKIYSENCTWT